MPRIASGSESIEQAASILRGGGVVAFPTETVYGLGADTFNDAALRRVYELKGRPFDNPLIAHVLDAKQARHLALQWDARCQALADRFWPGPLTIVVRKAETVPSRATAGYPTIAIRSPSHEIARELLQAFGSPISAPSANRSGHVSPTCAAHVAEDFRDVEDLLILDGGPCQIGIESTVLDLSGEEAQILRPGSVSAEAIGSAIGSNVVADETQAQAASPGTSPAHYAPRTPAELVDQDAIQSRLRAMADRAVVLSHHVRNVPPPHTLIEMPPSAQEYAARLYESLRRADAMNAGRILIESPNETGPLWNAIRDRLRRGTAHSSS